STGGLREWQRRPPPPPKPPNRIRHRASKPNACQKVTVRSPKTPGASQFHKSITTKPPIALKITMPTIPSGTIQIRFFFFIYSPQSVEQPAWAVQHLFVSVNRPAACSTFSETRRKSPA